jgi:hypothetical protein
MAPEDSYVLKMVVVLSHKLNNKRCTALYGTVELKEVQQGKVNCLPAVL